MLALQLPDLSIATYLVEDAAVRLKGVTDYALKDVRQYAEENPNPAAVQLIDGASKNPRRIAAKRRRHGMSGPHV